MGKEKIALCSKNFWVGEHCAFIKDHKYKWRWSTNEEMKDGFGEYCLESEFSKSHFLTLDDMTEYF